ncbi:MAG: OB-fold nucleic acid binding domain-containing protein, partial [Gammaproteobacteria bacterium]|nr:OB-fold nucleic acid binding domain-containing protein [Gammaproteobacteria bacterium]
RTVTVAGLVTALRTINSKRGRMAIITLDDRTARLEAAIYSDVYEHYRDVLCQDKLLVVEGEVAADDYTGGHSMSVQKVYDMDQARAAFAKRLRITVSAERAGSGFPHALKDVLEPYREGRIPVFVDYQRPDATARLRLGEGWLVNPTDELLHRLSELAGELRVQVDY